MFPVFTGLTILFLFLAVVFDNAGLAAMALICAFGGY
jgi:hypothetical protein